jgi:outer membrane protein assembly factor BamB
VKTRALRNRRPLALALTVTVLGLAVAGAAIPDSSDRGETQVEPAETNRGHDWPMLGGGVTRNMVNTVERNLPAQWHVLWDVDNQGDKTADVARSKNIKWAARLGSRTYGGPVVAGGKVFVGTNNEAPRDPRVLGDRGILMCFREKDGVLLWQAVHAKLATGQVNDWPKEGICSTPAIDGDRVYYVSNRCELVCADVNGAPGRQAKILWRLDMIGKLGVFPHNMANGSPVVAGSLVFVGTSNGVSEEHIGLPAPAAPSFVAVNKLTGALVWSSNAPGKQVMHGQWAPPAATGTQVIFPGGDGWLRSFDRTSGKPLWRFDANPKNSKYELGGRGTRSDFIAAPVVVGNRCYIGTGQDPEHYEGVGHLWCIDITGSGDVSPELVTDASTQPPKTGANPHSAVVWHYGGPVKPDDRDQVQRDYYFGRTISTVAVHDGLVYAAELAGYLHCLDARTGKLYWVHDLKAAVWGSPYWADGKIYIATEDGEIWIFDHGREKIEPRRVEMDQPIRTTPVAANGVLYLASESYLYAIQKR